MKTPSRHTRLHVIADADDYCFAAAAAIATATAQTVDYRHTVSSPMPLMRHDIRSMPTITPFVT